ncbi:MAG: hypothetical protein MUC88_23130 [Planctomycetes bacterium]|jgi:hypothetical protein|nr:hypothetical protein [Planctomycetota bacterium]
MLHDPSHHTPPPQEVEVVLDAADKDILRRLASELADIAALPIHREKARLWRDLNDLKSVRPMVWINEICWHEMNVDDELTLRCSHPWAQDQERELRRALYQWRHLPADMIVNDYLVSPILYHSTDFGITEDVDVVKTDESSDVVSRHFKVQIADFGDLEKIRMPVVTRYDRATALHYGAMCEVYQGILPVRKEGQSHIWFTPWDYLIRWWGIEQAMMDLIERPDLVHAAVDRLVDAWMVELDQFEAQNLLALDCNNTRIGSGGYGYTSRLPGADFDPARVRPHNMWGCSNAQIFSTVSPRMHWEFALEHDLRWLQRWGLTYYGCCEPLSGKIEILRRIPNLRKISVSPWCDNRRIVEQVGGDYVLSRKPSPAIFAENTWDRERARAELLEFLDAAGGSCHLEFIMKDISTVRYQPQRLWDWASLAMETVETCLSR